MRSLTRISLLLVVVAIAGGMTYAQGRPQCGTFDHNGMCFIDDNDEYACLLRPWDLDGDSYAGCWNSNDFCAIRPDGTIFCTGTEIDADLFVCPATAGGLDCIVDFFINGFRRPGMLIGSGKVMTLGVFTGDEEILGCPNTTHASGTVFDVTGNAFEFSDKLIRLKKPKTDGCRDLMNDIAVSVASE